MKQYLLKKWAIIIASLMAVSQTFASGGDTRHVVLRLKPATREVATQTDELAPVVAAQHVPVVKAPVPVGKEADTKKGDLFVVTNELFDEAYPVAPHALPNDAAKKEETLQDADNLKRALQLSSDELKKAADVARANGEDDLEETMQLSAALALSAEEEEIAKAIAESFLTAKKEAQIKLLAQVRQVLTDLQMIVILVVVYQSLEAMHQQEVARASVKRTCEQEFLAPGLRGGLQRAFARKGGLFPEPAPSPRRSARLVERAATSSGEAAPVVEGVEAPACGPRVSAGVSEDSLLKLGSLHARMADTIVVFQEGLTIDLMGSELRALVDQMRSGVAPRCEAIEASFRAWQTHVKTLTRKGTAYRKLAAQLIVAHEEIVRAIIRIAFAEVLRQLQTTREDNVGVLAQVRQILSALNEEKERLQRDFGIPSAIITSVE